MTLTSARGPDAGCRHGNLTGAGDRYLVGALGPAPMAWSPSPKTGTYHHPDRRIRVDVYECPSRRIHYRATLVRNDGGVLSGWLTNTPDPATTDSATDDPASGDPAATGLTGFDCAVCLDFGHIENLGPCPARRPFDADTHDVRHNDGAAASTGASAGGGPQ